MTLKKSKLKLDPFRASVSSLKTYESCPRKFMFRYVQGLPSQEWPHLALGNFVHEVLEKFHNVLGDAPEPEWTVLMSKTCIEKAKKFKLSMEHIIKAKDMLKQYLAFMRSDGVPEVLVSEQSFEISLSKDVVIRGFIDRIDNTYEEIYDDKGKVERKQFYTLTDYKGLALDTPIFTPIGWRTMEDLKVGDQVFGSAGQPINITVKSETHHKPCYKITMSDHSSVICDNDHIWNVKFAQTKVRSEKVQTIDADELFHKWSKIQGQVGMGNFYIENSKAIELPEKELPINPWLLGAWLGDRHSKTGSLSAGTQDLEEMSHLLNKHIPAEYMTASFEQRLSLLQGLMDSAGHWHPQRKRATFVQVDNTLFEQVVQLIRTFGVVVQRFEVVDNKGNRSNRLEFSPNGFNPFQLPRKANACQSIVDSMSNNKKIKSTRRSIRNMEKIDSVPTQCIAVDAEDKLYLCGHGLIPTHNTGKSKYLDDFQLIVYGLYLLEKDPTITEFKGTYLMLAEDMKQVSYNFNLDDIERAKAKILKVANDIKTDQTWEPKPTFLCSFCDYTDHCPEGSNYLVKIGKAPQKLGFQK